MVPLMTGWLGVPLAHAIPASLLGIIATSAASSLVYLRRGLADTELATKLLLPSVIGAMAGAVLATIMLASDSGKRAVALVFTAVILTSALLMFRRGAASDDGDGPRDYPVPGAAVAAVFGGGVLSTLLGVGGGIINVPVISLIVRAPTKIAIATSAYMIGVTAASGAAVYAAVGRMDAQVAAPTVVGLFVGAQAGARLGTKMSGPALRYAFCLLLLYAAYSMFRKALYG